MNYVTTLIRTAFQWAIFLAITGGLGEATLAMFKQARNAQSHGLISLSKLNHSLQPGQEAHKALRNSSKGISERFRTLIKVERKTGR